MHHVHSGLPTHPRVDHDRAVVHDNGINLEPAVGDKGFAATLAQASYDTAFFGKAHFSTYHTFAPNGSPECVKSSADFGPDWYAPYMGFAHTEMMLAGVAPQLTQHGESLLALLAGQDAPRAFARSEWELLPGRVGVGLSLRCVRTQDAKLTLELKTGVGEMYDLKDDPHEMRNLFDVPAYATLREQPTALIHARPNDAGPIRQAVGSA